ncbi:MAG TPA: NrfD/PsrC family molybdoenzyme membrane anchor subunit, partial [Ktedonobacteraceae bacterium]
NAGSAISTLLTIVLLSAVTLHIFLVMVEVFGSHNNSHVATAAHYITSGGLKDTFWGPFFAIGSLIPIVMLCIALLVPAAQSALLGFAGILALVGLFAYEHCFVTAGQVVPLS